MAKNGYYEQNGCVIRAYIDPQDAEDGGFLDQKVGNPCQNHPSTHYALAYWVQLKK